MSGTYKILGELAGADAVGVLGRNTAGTGTTYGVRGEVDSGDGYGLATPDDAKIAGTVDGGGTWIVEVEDDAGDTGIVVLGHPLNSVDFGIGATIGGGGAPAMDDPVSWLDPGVAYPNEISSDWTTIAGGVGNVASGTGATVGGGGRNLASESTSTVAGGRENEAAALGATTSGGHGNSAINRYTTVGGGRYNQAGRSNSALDGKNATVGGGYRNEATGESSTVAGGEENSASGDHAVVAGGGGNLSDENNTASGDNSTVAGGFGNEAAGLRATVPGGQGNVASGSYSFAAGRKAEALHAGAFVWSHSNDSVFSSSGQDQFLVDASGGLGVGTDSPASQLHVSAAESGTNDEPGGHVSLVEDPSDDDNNEILGLRTGFTGTPSATTNFVTFFDGNDDAVGAIEGTGSGGVTLDSGGSDFAEYLPRLDPAVDIEPGDVVGVVDGAVTRRTDGCEQVLVVSDQAIVTGNSPGGTAADREGYESVSLVGQVPTNVRGPVDEGDLVVASGAEDGTGRAVAPANFRPGDGPIVGRAWESNDDGGVTEVTVAVGLETGDAFGRALADQEAAIDDLERRNAELEDRLAALEARVGAGEATASGD